MRRFLCILCCCLLLTGLVPTAYAAGVTASVSTGAVTLNGVKIDNSKAQYPLLVYRDITYFPMTYYLCRFLGVTTRWDGKTLYIDRTGDAGEYSAETAKTVQKGRVTAAEVEYPVVINGTAFDNSNTKWPLLSYKNVTYFPLTYALAAEELGWEYHWDAENGLRINSGAGSIVDSGNSSSISTSDGELINSITRGFMPSVQGIDPGELRVELWSDWSVTGIQEAIRKAMADYTAGQNYSFVNGGPSKIQISYNFQYPAQVWSGMELKVPFTAVFLGQTVTLPSGNTYTPSGNTKELTATVQLCGQGNAAVDSAFQAGQAMYQRLQKCIEISEISVQANTVLDVSNLIQSAVSKKLYAAGLSEQYIIRAVSLGQHTTVLDAGKSMTVEFSVTFAPQSDSAPTQDVDLSAQAVFRAKS